MCTYVYYVHIHESFARWFLKRNCSYPCVRSHGDFIRNEKGGFMTKLNFMKKKCRENILNNSVNIINNAYLL